MPRRGGRDRYRTLKQVRQDTARREYPLLLTPEVEKAVLAGGKVVQNSAVLTCTHGVFWKDCTRCSKPVTR